MALGNGSATANGGVTQEKAPVVNGTNMETLPRTSKQTDPNTAFLRAARAGQLDKIQEYLDSGTIRDINTSNANGLNALHLAAKDGHIEVVRELLKRGAIIDAATKKGNTALHIASLAGQEEVVRLLIQHGASINVQSQNGFTPLYMAAQENHENVVRYLLSKGANQALATEDGFTPLAVAMQQGHDKVVAVLLENDTRGKVKLPALHIAAKKDDVKAATLLLQNDHNPDITSKSGFTPLHIAAHYGNDKVASLLYDKGADVNFSAKHNITPLHVASKWGKINMVSLLVAKGANIQAKTRDGLTPLHCAARSGHDQVVDMLLENGAPMHAKTKNGLAPLHMAAQGEHVDAARILLYHGAPVDEVTVDYLTALHVAAHCGHVRVAKLLLDRGADPNARALNGFTPLHIACKKNRIKMVELLLKHGANIGATTESGLTPLHVASFMGCMNIVIYLLQHEANPDIPTVRGETALHLAARANQTDIIRILLRNGAAVDAKAREEQTPLHVASRLGNVDIVMLLLQHGANPHATTKDLYTPLHIAAKEGQEEVASILLDNGADLTATTKKGFTPLHLAAKYGHLNIARLLLQRDAPADAQGKNGVTPLHVAAHYDHQPVALLLLDKGASPHAIAKNGHTPLHIAAKKNQMDIATTLLEYGAKADAESKAGFTPLHLSAQEGHVDMSSLLIEHQSDPNHASKNGLTPLHLCAQEDHVPVAQLLLRAGANSGAVTKSGYTPLHVACHHGHVNIIRLLLEQGADVNPVTLTGYTPLHQAAQQGHVLVIRLLLKNKANPNALTNNGQSALGIASKLGYISVIEELKVVTEVDITTTTTTNIEEKYRVMAPEAMQEVFMSDSEDEGGGMDEPPVNYGRPAHAQHIYLPFYQGQMNYSNDPGDHHNQYKYMTADDMKSFGGDDSMKLDVTSDEKSDHRSSMAPSYVSGEGYINASHAHQNYSINSHTVPDNVDINRHPITVGFLVSFLVDARGGAMRGCRHSGVRVIVPPKCAASPIRITCRYVRPQRVANPPPLMEGEALASRILELGPVGAKFLGPVILEVPHFASLRGKQREIIVLRSDTGETWKEHTLEASEEAIQDVLNHSFDGEELNQIEDLHTNRITRILTNDFPHYFAIVSRVRQEVHAIGPEGGTVSSTAVPLVQAVFPPNALTKKIKVGLQAQAVEPEIVAKLLGHGVAVSPIVTVEPRRRKFHKAITLSMPAPRAHSQGMINQYSGLAPTLRLLCSITGGQTKAVWEDVTGSTPLTFIKDCVSFTTTVSARFWLMDCRNVSESARMATELYIFSAHVPFMAKFVVFAKRISASEARIRVFCMTDDKEEKTLEHQEHFTEIAKSRDVEVLENKNIYMEFSGNLIPILQSGDQPILDFVAFRENRLAFSVRIKDIDEEPSGLILFMTDPKVARGDPPQTPICTLNLVLPSQILPDRDSHSDLLSLDNDHSYLQHGGISKADAIHRADFRLSDICNLLNGDMEKLAAELGIPPSDIKIIKEEYPNNTAQQSMVMFRLWLRQKGNKATGNQLEQALNKIGRQDIVSKCICNVELVTDDMERALAKVRLDQSGFDSLKDELGLSSREASLQRGDHIDNFYKDEERDKNQKNKENHIGKFTNDDLANTIENYLVYREENGKLAKENKSEIYKSPEVSNEKTIEAVTNDQDVKSKDYEIKTPPPSPAEDKFNDVNIVDGNSVNPDAFGPTSRKETEKFIQFEKSTSYVLPQGGNEKSKNVKISPKIVPEHKPFETTVDNFSDDKGVSPKPEDSPLKSCETSNLHRVALQKTSTEISSDELSKNEVEKFSKPIKSEIGSERSKDVLQCDLGPTSRAKTEEFLDTERTNTSLFHQFPKTDKSKYESVEKQEYQPQLENYITDQENHSKLKNDTELFLDVERTVLSNSFTKYENTKQDSKKNLNQLSEDGKAKEKVVVEKESPKKKKSKKDKQQKSDEERIAELKRNVSNTLTFLHQERNDFLPDEDIIIPQRKDDHVAKEINLDYIKTKKQHHYENVMCPEEQTVHQYENVPSFKHVYENIDFQTRDTTTGEPLYENICAVAKDEVSDVIHQAEKVVNEECDIFEPPPEETTFVEKLAENEPLHPTTKSVNDTFRNLEHLHDDPVKISQQKSEEAFQFLEKELSSPLTPTVEPLGKSVTFAESIEYNSPNQRELLSAFIESECSSPTSKYEEHDSHKIKSSIPVPKPRQKPAQEKDIDLLFSENDQSLTTMENELLSKIPVAKGKVKTIKKHSKDPLKEFVKLSQDINWDEEVDGKVTKTIITDDNGTVTKTTISVDPIVKTKTTKITSPEFLTSKRVISDELTEQCDTGKSKIPILKSETVKFPSKTTDDLTTVSESTSLPENIVSPGSDSKHSNKSSTLDSDSDTDSRKSPPLKGILKKNNIRTVGSSSGSDVALHEDGAELSEDESEDLCQNDQPQYTESITEEIDPHTGAKVTRTVRTLTQTVRSGNDQNQDQLRKSMQEVLDQFMTAEKQPQ